VVIANPTARWHTPVLGRLYRWGVQATVLRALGRLFAAGRTAPQALEFLDRSDDLPPVVQRRLELAREAVEHGEPLDDSLRQAELLPPNLAPLVHAAERARTLPWALSELGDHLAGQAFRRVRRISLVAGPLMVVAVGALVAFIALGMFMPLIQLLTRLSE
jgi:type II secretory pathway component PulF